jgi:hypothetical protein
MACPGRYDPGFGINCFGDIAYQKIKRSTGLLIKNRFDKYMNKNNLAYF